MSVGMASYLAMRTVSGGSRLKMRFGSWYVPACLRGLLALPCLCEHLYCVSKKNFLKLDQLYEKN